MANKQPTKEEISRYHDLVALRDRGWDDDALAQYAGLTVKQVKAILKAPAPTPAPAQEDTANG